MLMDSLQPARCIAAKKSRMVNAIAAKPAGLKNVNRKLPSGSTSEQFAYNEIGYVTNRIDFNGTITKYEYDKMNRLAQKIPPVGGWDPVVFKYTPSGQRASMKYPIGLLAGSEEVTYHYDSADRLSRKVTPQGTLQYTYEGRVLKKLETFHGATASIKISYEYDELNRVRRVTDDTTGTSLVTTYHYDAVGNLDNYTLPNAVRVDLKYNSLNQLTSIEHAAGSRLASFTYGVSPSGTRRSLSEYVQGFGTRNLTYDYDQIYRLGKETISGYGPAGTITYDTTPGYGDIAGYDQVGNRRSRTVLLSPAISALPNGTINYSYNSKDQITTTGETYDNNGNTQTAFDLTGTFGYNFENQLISQTAGTVSIVYDGDGNRVRKTANGITTHYLVDDRNPTGYAQVLEESSTLNGAADCVYITGIDLINQHRKNGASWLSSYYGYDGQGSVRFLTDNTGAISDRYAYDASGTVIWSGGVTPNNILYTGEQYDPDLKLYYLRARYMNPNTGRFLAMDTFGGHQSDPMSLHKYLYCGENPVNSTDFSGHDSSLASMAASGGIGLALASLILSPTTINAPGPYDRTYNDDHGAGAIIGAAAGQAFSALIRYAVGPALARTWNYLRPKQRIDLLRVRYAYPDSNSGTAVGVRIKIEKGMADGEYLFVIDQDGRAWTIEASKGFHHNSLVKANEGVLAAGNVRVTEMGKTAEINAGSGHFNNQGPQGGLGAGEAKDFEIGVGGIFQSQGFSVKGVSSGPFYASDANPFE
jgi:RHS repeat-associated protein